jgi:glycosyltransferase involved in cell wall biosynthesis
MQGAQTPFSAHRGIGRYAFGLAESIIKSSKDDEVYLLVNAAFPDAVAGIRNHFRGTLPKDYIQVFSQELTASSASGNLAARNAAEAMRELAIHSLAPDVVFNPNLQEGIFDNAVTSVNRITSNAVVYSTLADLIPLIYDSIYLKGNPHVGWYHEKLQHAINSDIIVTPSESSKRDISALLGVEGDRILVIPSALTNSLHSGTDSSTGQSAHLPTELQSGSEFFLYVGGNDFHKNIDCLFRAFAQLGRHCGQSISLALVGKEPKRDEANLRTLAASHGVTDRNLLFLGYVPDDQLACMYRVCLAFVFPSLYEGFGLPPLEAMAMGAPVLASNSSSIPEVVGNPDALFDPTDPDELSALMRRVMADAHYRKTLITKGLTRAKLFSFDQSAATLLAHMRGQIFKRRLQHKRVLPQPIDLYTAADFFSSSGLVRRLNHDEKRQLAVSLARTFPPRLRTRRTLFIDVSVLMSTNDHSGIQRVVVRLSQELLTSSSLQYDIECVHTREGDHEFYRASGFYSQFVPSCGSCAADDQVHMQSGDILFFLDMHMRFAIERRAKIGLLRLHGVSVYFCVYDLIAHFRPEWFWPDLCDQFRTWLGVVAESDGAICISQATAFDLCRFFESSDISHTGPFHVGIIRLGCDLGDEDDNSNGCASLLDRHSLTQRIIRNTPTFLMVGTIEPRKGHRQVLEAFRALWREGFQFSLVFAGREGWNVSELVSEIVLEAKGNPLFQWLRSCSDTKIRQMYTDSDALIMASEYEGFGLPLIEAARYNLPVICRDLPVFREVIGDSARFFSGLSAEVLRDVILNWLKDYRREAHPRPDPTTLTSWNDCSRQLIDIFQNSNWHRILE